MLMLDRLLATAAVLDHDHWLPTNLRNRMSTTVLEGLTWMLLGFAALGLGRLTEAVAARAYVRSHPDGDVHRDQGRFCKEVGALTL